VNGKPERPDRDAAEPEISARLAEIGVPSPVTGPVEWRKLSEMPEIQEAARMSNPDIQYFASSGTWVKPSRAVAVDMVTCGAGAGSSGQHPGEDGELTVQRLRADDLPGELTVTVGKGGRPGGRDGYALIVTHLADPPLPSVPPHDLMLHAHSHDHPDGEEPHDHLHTGLGHRGIEHSHPRRHASGEQR
jgi:hypothetical protein